MRRGTAESRRVPFIGLAVALLLWAGCASVETSEKRYPRSQPDARYDLLFPYYVELCAVSQIRANFAPHGGSPGHAAMFLKGACRDETTDYPNLKLCDPGVDLADPESGTGVSVNKMLRNVNWMAVPGRDLFFHGNLGPGQVLDVESGIATLDAAEAAGVFDGVEIHGSYRPPPGDEEALLYLAAAETLGTDFALDFGRTVFCSRVPMERRELEDVIGYLNSLNREYAEGEADYNWSGYNDNCSHTLRNALAAAGVWPSKSIRTYRLGQLANLSVPANEFANLAELSITFPVDDFDAIWRDRVLRQSLLERVWLPARHGSMLVYLPIHEDNELYDTQVRIFMLHHPFRRNKARRVGAMFDDPRATQLEANLRHWREVYRGILDERPAGGSGGGGNEKQRARAAYYRYIEAQLADVDAKLAKIGVGEGAP